MKQPNLDLIRFIGYVDGVLSHAESLEHAKQVISKEAARLVGDVAEKKKRLTFDEACVAAKEGKKVTLPELFGDGWILDVHDDWTGFYKILDGLSVETMGLTENDRNINDWIVIE